MKKITSFSKSTAWYTLGNLFVRSVGFILLPLFSKYISTSDFGSYAILIAVYTIVAVFYQAGLPPALSKFYLEEPDEIRKREVFATIFNTAGLIGLAGTIIIYIGSRSISVIILNDENYADIVRILFSALFFENLTSLILHLMQTNELAKKMVVYSVANAIINLVLNVYFIAYLKMGISGIFLAQLISSVFLAGFLFIYLKANYLPIINTNLLKKFIRFSYPVLIAGFLTALVVVLDRFILDYFLGRSEVGVYSFSYRIASIMSIFVFSLRSAWTPYSIRLYHQGEYTEEFGKSLTKIVAVSLSIFLLVSVFIDDVFSIRFSGIYLFDPHYRAGIKIIPVILISYFFNVVATYYSVYPYVSGKSIHFLISDFAALVINIVLNFLLIPVYGIMGAAVATLFSYLGSALYLVIISEKKIKITHEPVKIASIIFIAVVFYLVSKLINIFVIDLLLVLFALILFFKLTGFKIKFAEKV